MEDGRKKNRCVKKEARARDVGGDPRSWRERERENTPLVLGTYEHGKANLASPSVGQRPIPANSTIAVALHFHKRNRERESLPRHHAVLFDYMVERLRLARRV